MVDFNGFDKGVIGRRLPSDTTLNCMKKSELIKLLHLAEDNHRVLAETYKIAVDTNKCNLCPLGLDKRRADEIRADAIDELVDAVCCHSAFTNMQKDAIKVYAEQLRRRKNEQSMDL